MSRLRAGTLEIRTDAAASSTGFPFKVAQLPGTLSDPEVRDARPRLCDLSYLRDSGAVGYRCPGEPVHMYLRKGGTLEDTTGRVCLCNALTANVGLGQTRPDGYSEEPLVTLGADLDGARRLVDAYPAGWSAREALGWLLAERPGPRPVLTPQPSASADAGR